MRAVLLISVGILVAALQGPAHGYQGGPGPHRLTKLIRLLKSRDFQSSDWVPIAIGQLGPAAREARPALLAALNEEGRHSYFRGACVRALALTGPPEEFALEGLRKVCREDHDFSVRAFAAAALVRLDPAVGQEYLQILVDGLGEDDIESRLTAVEALALLGSPNNAAAKTLLPPLVNRLKDSDMHVRACAATALAKVSPTAPETIAALVNALQDSDEFVRWRAARDCREIGASAAGAVPQLANVLGDRFEHARRAAVEALAAIGADAQAAVPELIALLADARLREAAIGALANIGPAAVPPLIAKLRSERPEDRWQACRALAVMGPAAARNLPEILPLAHDEDASVRQAAVSALGPLHGQNETEVRATLSAALEDADADVRRAAAASFIGLGRMPPEAIRVLLVANNDAHGNWFGAGLMLQSIKAEELPAAVKLLQDDDLRVRQAAFWLVSQMGQSDPARAGAAVLKALTDDAGKVQGPAIGALRFLVAKHSGLLDQVLARWRDENLDVRSAIAYVLGAVDKADGKPAAEALVALLADARTQREGKQALVELGSRSDAALEVLLAAIRDADEESRRAIVWVLGQINATPNQEYWTVDFKVDPSKASDNVGKTAEKIVPALGRALDDPALCEAAGHMLVAIRPATEKGTFIEALHSPQATARERAARALGELAAEAREAIPALVTALADKDPTVRRAAAGALVHVGAGSNFAAGALAQAIALEPDNADLFDSEAACVLPSLALNHEFAEAMVDDTFTAHLLPVLLRKLQSQDADTACDAQTALIDLGFESPQVITMLEDVAKRVRGGARALAKEAIVAIETERALRRTSITEALASLRDADSKVRAFIAKCICDMHVPPDEAVPELIAAIDERRDDNAEEAEARVAVATTLAEVGGPTPEVMTAIARLLKDPDRIVRYTAAELLGGFGPKAREWVPALVVAAGDFENYVQCGAVTALGQIGPAAKTAAAPLLRQLFTDPDDELVHCAAMALAQIDPAGGEEAVPILMERFALLPDAEIRTTAEALGRLGAAARPALPVLISFWQRTVNYQLHEALAKAIEAIDPDAARAAGVR